MLTKQKYNVMRTRLNEYIRLSRQYCKDNQTNSVPIEVYKTFPKVTNADRSAIEVYEFCTEKPLKYFLYINEKERTATTWTGEKLGVVSFGRKYRDNFGAIRVPVTVQGINGISYYGTYYQSTGDYARITAFKKQRGE